jgi:hypothetical protein
LTFVTGTPGEFTLCIHASMENKVILLPVSLQHVTFKSWLQNFMKLFKIRAMHSKTVFKRQKARVSENLS